MLCISHTSPIYPVYTPFFQRAKYKKQGPRQRESSARVNEASNLLRATKVVKFYMAPEETQVPTPTPLPSTAT